MVVYEHVRAVDSISRKIQGQFASLFRSLLALLYTCPSHRGECGDSIF